MILKRTNTKILKAVMEAIIPGNGPFKAGAADFDLFPAIEKYLKSMDSITRGLFPILLKQIEYTSLFYRGKKFTKLGAVEASQFLKEMEDSAFYHNRGAVMLLKLLTTLPFFDIDEVTDQIGYKPDCGSGQEKIV